MINFNKTSIKFKNIDYKKLYYTEPVSSIKIAMDEIINREFRPERPMPPPTSIIETQPPVTEYIPGRRTIFRYI